MNAVKYALVTISFSVALAITPLASFSQQAVPETGTAKGIVLTPFATIGQSAALGPTENLNIAKDLSNMCGGSPDSANDNAADVNKFGTLGKYGVVSIVTHGLKSKKTHEVWLSTGEPVNDTTRSRHLSDLNTDPPLLMEGWLVDDQSGKYIYYPNGEPMEFWNITPEFVTAHIGKSAYRLFYTSACHGGENSTMADAFGGTYLGYSGVVYNDDATADSTAFFDWMTDLHKTPDQRTATIGWSRAMAAAGNLYPSDSNLAISLNPIINGGFEDKEDNHFVGWTRNFDVGSGPLEGSYCGDGNIDPFNCTPSPADFSMNPQSVVTDEEYTGPNSHHSAEIGRWNWKFNPTDHFGTCYDPNSGKEQAGDDEIYQVVQLGSGGPNAPQSFSLTFNYKIKSYDATPGEDYFWALAEDLDKHTKIQLTKIPAGTVCPRKQMVCPHDLCCPVDRTPPPSLGLNADVRKGYFQKLQDVLNSQPATAAGFALNAASIPSFTCPSGAAADWSTTTWQPFSANLSAFAGDNVKITFGVHDDGWGDQTTVYIDNVQITCSR